MEHTNSFKKFSHLLEHLNIAIVLLNSENRIQYLNPAAEVLFSLSIDRILNQPITSLLHNKQLLQKLLKSSQHGNAFTQREISQIIHGEEIIVDITVTPFTEKKGSIELLLEISPQNRYIRISKEEMLFSQQQVSRELLRGMAHEVKNPLGGIRGLLNYWKRSFLTLIWSNILKSLLKRSIGLKTWWIGCSALNLYPINKPLISII